VGFNPLEESKIRRPLGPGLRPSSASRNKYNCSTKLAAKLEREASGNGTAGHGNAGDFLVAGAGEIGKT